MAHPLIIKISNALAYVFLLSANIYSGLEGDEGGSPYHNSHETYITPAPFVFGVWGLIHLLLGGFVIYQFWDSANEVVVDVVHWHFVCIALLNTLWLTLWENDYLIFAAIVVLFISGQISYVYYSLLKTQFAAHGLTDFLFMHPLLCLSVAYIEGGNSDIAGSIVIAWTLIGIFVEQQDPIIHWISLILAIISIFHIVK
ncbi:8177_t:CDS:2, partial [Gigaspora margarita]